MNHLEISQINIKQNASILKRNIHNIHNENHIIILFNLYSSILYIIFNWNYDDESQCATISWRKYAMNSLRCANE